jgi:branched-chain amino acid transport system permease protein
MQFAITVLSNAAVLVPLVVGISLVYRISGTVVFAAGQIAIFSGMLYAFLNLPVYIALPITLVVGLVVAVLTFLAIVPAQRLRVPADAISIATLGIAFFLEFIGTHFLGRKVFSAPAWSSQIIEIAGAQVSAHRLVVIGVAAAVAVAVILFVDRTLVGRAMEATAFDPQLSQMYGIRVQRFRLLAWVIAGFCFAIVGVFQVTLASASQPAAIPLLTLALASAVIGGLGGLYAGIAGAVLIALVQAAVAQFISSELQVAVAFALLFVVLVVRPSGLFTNSREARRV